MDDMNGIDDQELIKAIRRRLLAEIEKGGSPVERIVNNVYGSPGTHGGQESGVFGALSNAAPGEGDPFEYYVDIARRNVTDPEDPSKVVGWDKNVRRYTKKKA